MSEKPRKPKDVIEVKCIDGNYYVFSLSDCKLPELKRLELKLKAYRKYWETK